MIFFPNRKLFTMDDDIEDIVGDVKRTDSQKSVATSNVYTMEFTDCSSERYNSSGKGTYVIDHDTSEDSDINFPLRRIKSTVNLKDKEEKKSLVPIKSNLDKNTQFEITTTVSRAASTSSNRCSIFAQETFTQTSKTIIELASLDIERKVDSKTLETQTSLVSITENRTMEYRIEINNQNKYEITNSADDKNAIDLAISLNQAFNSSLDDGSSKFPVSETENEGDDADASYSSSERLINILNVDSKEIDLSEEQNDNQYENTSDFETTNTDIEEDSLMEQPKPKVNSESLSDVSDVPKSVDNDIEELYTKLSGSINEYSLENPCEIEKQRLSPLTTLTEESALIGSSKVTSIVNTAIDDDVLFTNNEGMKIKLLPEEVVTKHQVYELPPIRNGSCPNSPPLNFLFSMTPTTTRPVTKSGTLPSVVEGNSENRWEITTRDLAAGESTNISGRSDSYPETNYNVHLPPIHAEGCNTNQKVCNGIHKFDGIKRNITEHNLNTINIKNKIKDLKMSSKSRNRPSPVSRSGSPSSASPDESRLCDLGERGCEALCVELLRQLRSSAWYEIPETLDNVPKLLEKFWGVIAEQRIADLIRQIIVHVESPRPQIARLACFTLASVLKNTNYTKKPDFYEAMTILLMKTGSFSKPVRRAANIALDDVVCGVDPTHAVTALCVHGVGHKSALVRCAASRLLVVCCALAAGGRELLRARPPTAACARKHALRSLATLLEDKNTDTRKYAERLYSMLRPLPSFEAYYLTDVDTELASRQMKKYDQLLLLGAAQIR